jgi:diguanylate cyclase (GGDEF)-like protein
LPVVPSLVELPCKRMYVCDIPNSRGGVILKKKKVNAHILLTCLGFAFITAAMLFIFIQFDSMMKKHSEFSANFYDEYITNLNNTTLWDMSEHIEHRYHVLQDTALLKEEAGSDWFWQIADEWHELTKQFHLAYIYYIEKADDNYIFLMSSGIRRDTNPEWLGGPVWEGKPPAVVDEAWKSKQITYSREPTVNEWGTHISIVRPILVNGNVAGILGIDYDISYMDKFKYYRIAMDEQENTIEKQIAIIFSVTIIVSLIIINCLFWLSRKSVMVSMRELSATDSLTGIPNRRGFDERLNLEWNRAKRDKAILSMLMMDIDKFKNYNDTYGHLQGDKALQSVAKTIEKSLKRSTDYAARWGGEEFVVLLPATDMNGAHDFAESIRRNVENTLIPCENNTDNKVTISVGINTITPEHESVVEDFTNGADQALYRAKETGRNRVCTYADTLAAIPK